MVFTVQAVEVAEIKSNKLKKKELIVPNLLEHSKDDKIWDQKLFNFNLIGLNWATTNIFFLNFVSDVLVLVLRERKKFQMSVVMRPLKYYKMTDDGIYENPMEAVKISKIMESFVG